MTDLLQMKCVACRAGEPTLTEGEISTMRPQIPDWQVREVDAVKRLERVFKFKNFSQAFEFTNKVGGNCSRKIWLKQERQDRRPHQLHQFLKSVLAVAFRSVQDSG